VVSVQLDTDEARAESHARPSSVTLWLCAAAALFEGFDNQSMGVAAPRLAAEFALTAGEKGFVFSAAAIGLAVGAIVGGRVADIIGRKRTLVASMLLFGAFSVLTAFATSATTFFVARLLTGLGLGGAMPNFIALASEAAHPSKRLVAVTMVTAGMPFGGTIAALIALGERFGWDWRVIFYVGGVGPIVVALLMLRYLTAARHAVPMGEARATHVHTVSATLFASRRTATTLLLWTGFFFTQLLLLLMLNWLPSLMIGFGFTTAQASWASVCFNLSGSVGAVLLSRLHAGRHRRAWVLVTYLGIALALALIPAVGSTFALAAIACAFAGVFIIGAQLILFALAPLYYPSSIRGTGVGASVAVGRVGSIVGPLFASALLIGGGNSASVLLGILPFVVVSGTAAFALTWRPQADAQFAIDRTASGES
jgi:AAHS family 3-hydroxyphenylpropionic acid transporter